MTALVKKKCILPELCNEKNLAQMLEGVSDLHWVVAYFANPVVINTFVLK